MMLAAGMFAANAAVETTYTYNFEEQVWSEAGVQNLGGINWDLQASFTKEVFFGWDTFNDKGQQIGSGSKPASSVTLATSGLSGTIKNVTVETSGAKDIACSFEVSVGSTSYGTSNLEMNSKEYSFDGSSQGEIKLEWTNTSSKAIYLKAIKVTYEATQCAAPTFSLAEGTYYEAQNVALSCATPGATILYTINGGAEQTYSSAIRLAENGTYKIEAYAKIDGASDSEKVSATYTIADAPVIPFSKMDPANVVEGDYVIAYTEDGVTYVMKNEVWKDHYVTGVTCDLTTSVPSDDCVFTVKKSGNGYTIQNSDGTYVALVKSGKYTNLKPAEATPYVWTFSGTADGVVATGDGMDNSYLQFTLYNGSTPEFLAYSRYESPVFYLVKDNTPEGQLMPPVFSLESGTYFGAQKVQLVSQDKDATIIYTINGGAEQTYTAPIELTEFDEYTIVAYAKKDGMTDSEKVTKNYTISDYLGCESIDDFKFQAESEAEGTVFEWNFPVIVTAQMPGYTYVKDEAGDAMLIYYYDVPTYKQGDVIPAGVCVTWAPYDGLEEVKPLPETMLPATGNVVANPIVMTAGEIERGDMNKVVYLDNVTYVETKSGNSTTRTAEDATGSIRLWMQKDWDVQTPENGTVVDLVCAVAVNNEDLQVYPMQFRDASEEPAGVEGVVAGNTVVMTNADGVVVVAAEAAEVSVYTAAGQLVAAENVAAGESVINVPAGFYIVKAGDTVAKVIVK